MSIAAPSIVKSKAPIAVLQTDDSLGDDGGGGGDAIRWCRPLSDPEESEGGSAGGIFPPSNHPQPFSELVRLVRCQIEIFTATPEDLTERKSRGGRAQGVLDVGRVGIRCRHCVGGRTTLTTPDPTAKPARGAVSYPNEIRLVYQAVRNWQRHHFAACPAIPEDVKARHAELKAEASEKKSYPKKRSGNDSVDVWEESLRRMGLVDTPDRGIRLAKSGGGAGNECCRLETAGTGLGIVDSHGKANCGTVSGGICMNDIKANVRQPITGEKAVEQLPSAQGNALYEAKYDMAGNKRATAMDDAESERSSAELIAEAALEARQHAATLARAAVVASRHAEMIAEAAQVAKRHVECRRSSPLADVRERNASIPFCSPEGPISASTSSLLLNKDQNPKVSPFQEMKPDDGSLECEIIATIRLGGGATSPLCTPTSAPERLSADKVALVERLELARDMVRTVNNMRRLPPPPDNGDGAGLLGGEAWARDGPAEGRDRDDEHLQSLGAELYELFAGRRPFDDGDVVAWQRQRGEDLSQHGFPNDGVHETKRKKQAQRQRSVDEARGGKEYVPLSQLGIPSAALCGMVSSLLGGTGGTSCGSSGSGGGCCLYSSVEDIEEDLRLMTSDPERYFFDSNAITKGELPDFDIPLDALYGREREVAIIHEAYDRAVSGGATMTSGAAADRRREAVLLYGYSGSGKSEIVRKAQDDLVRRGARFVSGKFDTMQQVQPLSALLSGLDEFCESLSQDCSLSDKMRVALREVLGGEVEVLINLIPNLGKVVGSVEQSSVHIDGRQAKQRLFFLFKTLFEALCSNVGSLVLFLDDIQWADEPSLELLRVLMADINIKGLLFIGTYRDNEVDADHPLSHYLEDIKRMGSISVTSVHIGNLDKTDVSALLADTLHLLPRMTLGLAEIVVYKTGGNALFVVQFLHTLYFEGLLRFSLSTKHWEWDTEKIQSQDIAENVVELMKEKLLRLEPAVQSALTIAAVFGAKCDESVFHILDRGDLFPVDQGSIAENLDLATVEGLVVREGSTFKFQHDQIQLAAYQLIPESSCKEFHLQVGRVLWKLSSAQELQDFLFVVVDQLHRGSCLMTCHGEKIKFAQLCLLAAKKASAMSAFLPASVYLKAGINMLIDEDWDNDNRELALDLYSSCAELEYILGDFASMQGHLECVLTKASTLREKLRAYSTSVQSLGVQQKTKDAIRTAFWVLRELGESFPSAVTSDLVRQEISSTRIMLEGVGMDSLHEMATMQDTDKREAMKMFAISLVFTHVDSKDLFALLACRMVQLSLSHGASKESSLGFACFGMILCATGYISVGHCLGKTALSIVERFQAKELVPRLYVVVHAFINPCVQPIQSSLPCLKQAIDIGLSVGDADNAMMNAHFYAGIALQSGKPLGPLMEELVVHSKQMLEYNPLMWTMTKPLRQTALNLLSRSPVPFKLVGEEMDEDSMLMNSELSVTMKQTIYVYRMWLEYIFGEYDLAAETAEKNQDVAKHRKSRVPMLNTYVFYAGLAAIAVARNRQQQRRWIGAIDDSMELMKEWAASSSWTFQHKVELLNAEYAYLSGNLEKAAKKYELAAELAAAHHFVHEEALALERAGIFYSETGDHATALDYFMRACECYTRWGACRKVAHIQERYL